MKLHRFVIGFILGSSLTVLVAGIWFHRPGSAPVKPPGAGNVVVAIQR